MKSHSFLHTFVQSKRSWISIAVFALFFAIFIGVFGSTALATPANQTVPPPTATAANTPVPTATANQNNNDNDNNDNNDSPPPPTATPTPEGLMATVTVVRLNVRQGPGTTYDVLGVVASGQTLRVLARNEAGDWWQICCLPGSNRSGWVASQFLQANFDLGQANTLIPLADDLPTPPEPTPIPTADPFGATAPTDTILFQMQQDPLYTWQGQEVSIVYLIANTTENPAVNLELRNEFSNQLRFVAIEDAGGGTALTETTDLSNTIISVTWPELTIDAETEVRVRVQVANDIPDGGVIDNLAVIVADNITAITAGISIGMPPTTLPDFR